MGGVCALCGVVHAIFCGGGPHLGTGSPCAGAFPYATRYHCMTSALGAWLGDMGGTWNCVGGTGGSCIDIYRHTLMGRPDA